MNAFDELQVNVLSVEIAFCHCRVEPDFAIVANDVNAREKERNGSKETENDHFIENLLLFQLQYNAHWHKFMLRQPTKSANL